MGPTAGTFVTTVSASDLDRGTNGVVRYNVTSGDSAKLFTVDAMVGSDAGGFRVLFVAPVSLYSLVE